MADFLNKISLYDILAMLVPGGTLYIVMLLALGFDLSIDDSKISLTLAWVIALAFSYILGLINQTLTYLVWNPFRNNPQMIVCKDCKVIPFLNIVIRSPFVWLYILGAIFLLVKNIHTSVFYSIIIALILFCLLLICFLKRNKKQDSNNKIVKNYLIRYYYVATHRYRNDTFIIEGQIAFLQNMLIPLLSILALPNTSLNTYCYNENSICVIRISLCCIIILSIIVIFFRQMKVYRCIMEDYMYLKRINKQENKE